VRTDENLDTAVRNQDSWEGRTHHGQIDDPINQSFSGEERNRWYHNRPSGNGRDLQERSILSGLDSISDGRAFAIGDFNHDGRPDIALCNANAPLLQIFENQIDDNHNFVALRFEGSATQEPASGPVSNRDGYGTTVKLTLDNGRTILREFRCGEGFAAQNSDTILVGIGEARTVEQVEVTWPSGNRQTLGPIPSGHLQSIEEDADRSAVVSVPYSPKKTEH
jgi:hypothetical protein